MAGAVLQELGTQRMGLKPQNKQANTSSQSWKPLWKQKRGEILWLVLPSSLLPVPPIGQIYLKASCQGNLENVVACNADGISSSGIPPKGTGVHTIQTPELQALAVLTLQASEGHSQAGVQSLLGFMAGT